MYGPRNFKTCHGHRHNNIWTALSSPPVYHVRSSKLFERDGDSWGQSWKKYVYILYTMNIFIINKCILIDLNY